MCRKAHSDAVTWCQFTGGAFDTLLQPSSYDSAYISVFCNSLVAAAYESNYLTGSSARRWKGRRN